MRTLLFITIMFLGFSGFCQKKKALPIDSLIAQDIREVRKTYPGIVVRTSENSKSLIPVELNPGNKQGSIRYPQQAMELGITGTVYGRFIIDTLGQINDIRIIKGLGGGCSEEALRVLNALSADRFLPYMENGKKTFLYISVPFRFQNSN